MRKVVPFPNDQTTREQASMWMARLDRGLRAGESGDLQNWICESASNREALLEMSRLWDRLDILTEISDLFPLESRGKPGWWRQWGSRVAALACVIVLAAVPSAIWIKTRQSSAPPRVTGAIPAQEETTRYRTGMGQQRVITLSDHSKIALNTDSELSVHYTPTERTIELSRGEAHFKVAKDVIRVFTVRVAGSEFKAVGTAFNLRRMSEQGVELTVMEGRVKVLIARPKGASQRNRMDIAPLESSPIVVDAGGGLNIDIAEQTVRALPPARIEAKVAWTNGMMVFDGESLERVIGEVGRYSSIKFVIADDELRQIPVAGYFKIGDIDGLVAALQANFNINASRDGSTITLRAAQTQ